MTKSEMIKDIVTVTDYARINRQYSHKVNEALQIKWYSSNELLSNVLLRQKKERLEKIWNDVVEAIY